VNGQLNELIAALAMAAFMIALLAAFCAAGPLADRVTDRRIARRRAAAPIRIAQWTGHSWAEVPLRGARW
jgi:hypothetical protein